MSCTILYRCLEDGESTFPPYQCESAWNPEPDDDVAPTSEDRARLGFAATEAAEDYHDGHDGWEAKWPRTFVLYREDGSEIGRAVVEREAVPSFTHEAVTFATPSFPEGTKP